MLQVVCRLCRARIDVEPGASDPRCPKCGGRVLPDQLRAATAPKGPTGPTVAVACPSCLRILRSSGPVQACSYCGGEVDRQEGERLAVTLEGLEGRTTQRLLDGTAAAEIVADLGSGGISSERAWHFVDRLLSELPFERHKAWKEGRPVPPPPACDACGVPGGALVAHEAEWGVSPEELQRYRSGWGGFEGDFGDRRHYTRQALYHLCPRCAKTARTPEFAGGYPHRFGFRIEKFRKA